MSLIVDIEKKLGSFTLRSKFETDKGTMALLGASGCGKSVTLKCIAGIMTPDKGPHRAGRRDAVRQRQAHRSDAPAAACCCFSARLPVRMPHWMFWTTVMLGNRAYCWKR